MPYAYTRVASERAGNNLSSSYVAITKERVGEDIE